MPRPVKTPAFGLQLLEPRIVLNASYFALANSALSQNWSAITLISTSSQWANIPGIEGFNGSTITGVSAGADPQSVVAPDAAGAVPAVTANQTDPSTLSAGGLAEFHLLDPTVAMQGTPAASAPHLVFYLNTSDVTSGVRVSFTLRDIDAQATAALQPIALQYRIGTSGNFTNIPSAFTANAAGNAGEATKVTQVSAILPAAVLNQPQVQVRVITADAIGADEWIGVDNISIQATPPTSVQFSLASAQVNESAGSLNITVTRSGDATIASQVVLSSVDGQAIAGSDFGAVNQILNFAVNETSKTIAVAVINDTAAESAERFTLTLSDPSGATLGTPATQTITIIDNDSTVPAGLVINELEIDPPGSVDTPYESAEIRGGASSQLFNVYLVQFEGDETEPLGGAGVSDHVFDLGASTLGTNGMLLIKSADGFAADDPATSVMLSTDLSNGTNALENDTQTWALIFSPVPIVEHFDYSTSSVPSGTLSLPAGAVVLDSVGWQKYDALNGFTGVLYTDAALSLPATMPQAATRLRNNTSANSAAAWYFGWLSGANGAASRNYDAVYHSANLPLNAMLTPGAANYSGSADEIPPAVSGSQFEFDGVATPPALTVSFSEPVHNLSFTDLGTSSFSIVDRSSNTPLAASNFTLTLPSSTTAKITFTGASGAPADGDFKLVIRAANVKDLADNPMTGDLTTNFSFLQGDANLDRLVDTSDFNLLAGNFGDGGHKFSEGDFSFDGNIDSVDFAILLAQYGKRLPTAPPAIAASSPLFAGLHSDTRTLRDLTEL